MFGFIRKTPLGVDEKKEEKVQEPVPALSPFDSSDEETAVEQAIRIIQHHLDKEAASRRVEHLTAKDLCPRQKADLYRDLVKLFGG